MGKIIKIDTSNLLEKFIPILLLAAIVLSFFVGSLWQKVANLEKGGAAGTAANAPTAQQGPALAVDDLKKYAKEIGLDTGKFNSCLDSGETADAIKSEATYGETLGITGTPGFFLNGHLLVGAQPFQTFKEALDFELKGGNWNNPPTSLAQVVGKEKLTVDTAGSPSKGDKNAKVVLVEFSDFQCPYCANFFRDTEGQLIKDYVDTGKVLLVYKHFPLYSIHPLAEKAAEAAVCADKQGKFWEMHDKLFNAHFAS